MQRNARLGMVAPCGQDCAMCLDNAGSPVSLHARDLWRALDDYGAMAGWRASHDEAFVDYVAFERVLARLAGGGCLGCRGGVCPSAGCAIRDCAEGRGVDFCYQCPEFPCDGAEMPEARRERWKRNNERIAVVGLAAYIAEMRGTPR